MSKRHSNVDQNPAAPAAVRNAIPIPIPVSLPDARRKPAVAKDTAPAKPRLTAEEIELRNKAEIEEMKRRNQAWRDDPTRHAAYEAQYAAMQEKLAKESIERAKIERQEEAAIIDYLQKYDGKDKNGLVAGLVSDSCFAIVERMAKGNQNHGPFVEALTKHGLDYLAVSYDDEGYAMPDVTKLYAAREIVQDVQIQKDIAKLPTVPTHAVTPARPSAPSPKASGRGGSSNLPPVKGSSPRGGRVVASDLSAARDFEGKIAGDLKQVGRHLDAAATTVAKGGKLMDKAADQLGTTDVISARVSDGMDGVIGGATEEAGDAYLLGAMSEGIARPSKSITTGTFAGRFGGAGKSGGRG